MSEPCIVITRAQPGAQETAERVKAMNLRPVISPALSLELVDPVPSMPLEQAAGPVSYTHLTLPTILLV